jgi:hypothetical protein
MADLMLETLSELPREELERVLREEAQKNFSYPALPVKKHSSEKALLSFLFSFMGLRKKARSAAA